MVNYFFVAVGVAGIPGLGLDPAPKLFGKGLKGLIHFRPIFGLGHRLKGRRHLVLAQTPPEHLPTAYLELVHLDGDGFWRGSLGSLASRSDGSLGKAPKVGQLETTAPDGTEMLVPVGENSDYILFVGNRYTPAFCRRVRGAWRAGLPVSPHFRIAVHPLSR